ncbi:hypothetical protein LTR10_019539 [Elasticomyces elasticus]|uniref:Gfd2/YDR514C-like C-terminal domain-containing protein n=1 Tax=Exophiala sideris TaxID=1016849 RepID=A0ABR0J5J9_9EURO|nr:hypothetical protein LTR10_019539 [Elasticomyces elasticus]KAK5028504.1 hypothetical protein LTS07_006595 [Exophiala sideris]KAK5035854.1 hypothetical protein LTR13_005424 [Exophiala sideris]KAK5056890.1 hypothetical protein LTR69_007528 [Exophiala sideris]KAK5181297.1 hypothetical protein LTR44_006092 [Eurotiomycetes sp. CCFEE 6388]
MATAPRSRLNQLFAGQSLPGRPTPGQPHFSEQELQEKAAEDRAAKDQVWKLPATAQYPRKIKTPPKPTQGVDLLSSSDDDEYVSSFRKKPSMKSPTKQSKTAKPRVMPEPNAFGYPKEAIIEPKGPIEYIAKGKTSLKPRPKQVATYTQDSDEHELPTSNPQGAPANGHFCQFSLASKFPYKYMNDSNDRVSRHFFANNKFYDRTWDIYYLNPPYSLSAKPIILVPYAQVENLINDIGRTFKIAVSVPKSPFTLTFFDDGTPQPELLGTSRSRDEFTQLQSKIEPTPEDHGECPPKASPEVKQQFEAFRKKCEDAMAASKKKGVAIKKKREDDRLLTIRDWYSQLRRVQRYFGLRRKSGKVPYPDPGLSWDEQEEFRVKQLKEAHIILDPLDVNAPAPFPFEKEPIIISVDIESYERAHNQITEIGVSTLDTLDLVGLPPGKNGKTWINQIRSRHFRIKGREHLVNKDFCVGNPDAFQFGRSEFVELKDAAAQVDSCFEWPFSVQYKHAGLEDPWDDESASVDDGLSRDALQHQLNGGNKAAIASVLNGIGDQDAIDLAVKLAKAKRADPSDLQKGCRERNILLVGHDLRTDLDYLRDLGSKIFGPSRGTYPVAGMEMMGANASYAKILASIQEALDTAPLYRILKEETQNRNLGSIMKDLGLTSYFMHNGGNDARYTLEVLVAMVIKARLRDDDVRKEDEKQEAKATTPQCNVGNQPSHMVDKADGVQTNQGQQQGVSARKVSDASLDAFEAAIMASSDCEPSPPREKDQSISRLTERLSRDPLIDDEEPKTGFLHRGTQG